MIYKVIQGKKNGRKIGFPTLNLEPTELNTKSGVYACEVFLKNNVKLRGILHYGKRTTVDQKITLEIHLLNFNKNLYGKKIKLKLGQKIREIRKFKNLKELKKQITDDIKKITI